MVRSLYLIRHADAEYLSQGQSDHERALTRDGLANAGKLGLNFKKAKVIPNKILCSTALRARSTAETLCDQLGIADSLIHLEAELYESSVRILLQSINGLDETHKVVFMVAHNPSISYLAEYLTDDTAGNMVPGSACQIDFEDMAWAEVSQKSGRLISYTDPNRLNTQ